MIKALFFDLGKVLVDFDWTPVVDQLSRSTGKDPSTIRELLTGSPLAMNYETGLVSSNQFFGQLKQTLGGSMSEARLRQFWSDIFSPMQDNIDRIRSLKGQCFLGLISNTNDAHLEWIRKKFHFLDLFDRLTLSYQVNSVKPEPGIFNHALGRFAPEEVWFVDDTAPHVGAARRLGWRAVQLQPGQSLDDVLPEDFR